MAIKLDENYTIEQDSSCWTLRYEKISAALNDKGNPIVSRDASYHGTLQQALRSYLDDCLKPSSDAQDVLARINEVVQRIDKAGVTI